MSIYYYLLHVSGNTSYTWDIYPEFDIFIVNEYGKMVKQLTNNNVYDAEGTLNPQGDKIVFTSLRSGDPELYTMNLDGSDVKQVRLHLLCNKRKSPLTNFFVYRSPTSWATTAGRFLVPMGRELSFALRDQKLPKKLKFIRNC